MEKRIILNVKYYKNLLTIGIPAYNEGKYLRKTLELCVEQAGCVIISDNASTDETQQICEEFAKKYSNIKYIRQEKNIGGSANFMACVDAAETKYFMWHGGHDYLDLDYSKHMLHMLENSDAIGCWPASRAVDKDDNEIGIFDCWFADRLTSDVPAQRVYTLIAHLHECVALVQKSKRARCPGLQILFEQKTDSNFVFSYSRIFLNSS